MVVVDYEMCMRMSSDLIELGISLARDRPTYQSLICVVQFASD